MTRKAIILSTIITAAAALPTAAELRIGPKAGVCINHLNLDNPNFKSSNRVGFVGGLMAEVDLVWGFSVDASALYVRRESDVQGSVANEDKPVMPDNPGDILADALLPIDYILRNDCVSVPINLKYRLNLLEGLFEPFVTTGPEVYYMTNYRRNEGLEMVRTNVSWHYGFGVQLLGNFQVAASHGTNMYRTMKADHVKGSSNCWTVTATYLF